MAKGAPDSPAITRRVVRLHANGQGLHGEWVEPAGADRAPVLVLLHEGLGCTGFWKDLPERLAALSGLPVFLYDRTGYGRSDPAPAPRPLDYLAIEAERALPEVLRAAGIERPILIGHSDGGTIALLFAAAFPDRVEAVVAIAAHVFVEEQTIAGIRDAVRAFEAGELRHRLERFHGPRTEAVFRAWADVWLDPRFRSWNVTDRLARIRAPLLVLQGEADEYATAAQVEAIVGGVGGPVRARLLPGAGHVPHHQTRAATLAAIGEFFAGLGLAAAQSGGATEGRGTAEGGG